MKKFILILALLLATPALAKGPAGHGGGKPPAPHTFTPGPQPGGKGGQKTGHATTQAEDDQGDDGDTTDPWAYLYDPLTGRITDPVRCWRADVPGCLP